MNGHLMRLTPALIALAVAAGCGGGLTTMISSNAEMRDKVMAVFAGNGALAGQMADRLLASDSTQAIVIDRLLGNGAAVQALMVRMARDRTIVDGVLTLAVQDTSMRTHVKTLFQGMAMGSAAPH